MAVGIITGSGTHALPGFDGGEPEPVATPWGVALVSSGRLAGVDVLHVSRHGAGHVRLSNHVTHRANIAALARAGAAGVREHYSVDRMTEAAEAAYGDLVRGHRSGVAS